MSGNSSKRVAVVTANERNLPVLICGRDDAVASNMTCTWPANKSVSAGVEPRYGTCTISIPAIPRVGLGVGDELGHGLGWDRWINLQDEGEACDSPDGRDVPNEIEIEFLVERGVDGVC